jgi:hypothetical protein
VDLSGDVFADGTARAAAFSTASADVAEWVHVSEPVDAGDVLELDPANPGAYRKSRGGCSQLVAGVVSTEPGLTLGERLQGDRAPLALAGIVPVKACVEGGSIEPGDLLVAASVPGYVRRRDEAADAECGLVGKALTALVSGDGLILVLLMH